MTAASALLALRPVCGSGAVSTSLRFVGHSAPAAN
jgi:hypothetical protein